MNEAAIRPSTLAECVNQHDIKTALNVAMESARLQHKPLKHVLLYGPPGLGKTTLAGAIAHDMGGKLITAMGPALEKSGDVASLVAKIRANDVLFIDEIHALTRAGEEVLGPVMEDYVLDIIAGAGQAARPVRIKLPPFTLIGATTKYGKMSSPLRDRFGHVHRLEYYSPADLELVIQRTARILKSTIETDAARELATRARGTPRIANRLFDRAFDFTVIRKAQIVTAEDAGTALDAMEIDGLGLDKMDRRLLEMLIDRFNGRPTGLLALASALNEDPSTIENVVEPYLSACGLISRTNRGRIPTGPAYEHMWGQIGK